MGRQRGAFSSFASSAKSEPKVGGEASTPGTAEATAAAVPANPSVQGGSSASSGPRSTRPAKPPPDLSLDELRGLLESLRTVSMQPDFQKALQSLQAKDWGAVKKRLAFAQVLAASWKEVMRARGFSIDEHGFPQLLAAVRSQASQPGIKTLSEEVERHMKFVPGALFGAKAGEMKQSAAKRAGGAFSKVAAEPGIAGASDSKEPEVLLRDRPLNLGECKDLLRAFREVLASPEAQNSIKNLYSRGDAVVKQMLPMLIGTLLNTTMSQFDYPLSEEGYQEMIKGVQKHSWNTHVKMQAHELERLFRMAPGALFLIPGENGQEAGQAPLPVGGKAPQPQRRAAGPGDVEVTAKHAVDGTELKVVVSKDATFQELKSEIAGATGRNDILNRGRLVQRRGGTYTSYKDTDPIGDVTLVLVLGADLRTDEEDDDLPPVNASGGAAQPVRPMPFSQNQPGSTGTAATQSAQPQAYKVNHEAMAAKQEPRPPALTYEKAVQLQKELLRGFSTQEFQSKLRALHGSMEQGTVAFRRERQKLFLTVQSTILPKYGFQGNPKGVFDMTQAFEPFNMDAEIARVGYELNIMLGLIEPPQPPPQPEAPPQPPQPPPAPAPVRREPSPEPPRPPPAPPKPPEEVQVVMEHALEEGSIELRVMDNSSMLELRKAVMAKLGETKLSQVKIVSKLGDGFQSVPDDRPVGTRRHFLVMGRSLVLPKAQDGAEAPSGAGATAAADAAAAAAASRGRQPENPQGATAASSQPKPHDGLVEVFVQHALDGTSISVTVKSSSTIHQVREAVMAKLAETKLSQVKIVKRLADQGLEALPDEQALGDRRSLLCLGRPLSDMQGQPPAEQAQVELIIHIDENLGLKNSITVNAGSSIWAVKEQLAQAASGIRPQDICLRLPAGGRVLEDGEHITSDVKELSFSSSQEVVAEPERRLAEDGQMYLLEEFVAFYGEAKGRAEWEKAASPQPSASPSPLDGSQAELQLVVHIDRHLGLSWPASIKVGTTIRAVKEQIAADDPTGLDPSTFFLKLPELEGGRELGDDEVVTSSMTEFDLGVVSGL